MKATTIFILLVGRILYAHSNAEGVYCPKCDKTIKRERIAEINITLKEKFKSDKLERGLCPVCGTRLFDLTKKEAKKDAN